LQFGAKNRNNEIHGSITIHTDESILFVSHAKQLVCFYYMKMVVLYENV